MILITTYLGPVAEKVKAWVAIHTYEDGTVRTPTTAVADFFGHLSFLYTDANATAIALRKLMDIKQGKRNFSTCVLSN